MHFYCNCGYRISDTTDHLSYKASVLADQDRFDYIDGIEALIKDERLSREECWEQIFMGRFFHYFGRDMYQCPKCGRIYLEDASGELHAFVPEGTENRRLLTSVEGEAWKGFLWAEWEDEKPDWTEHRGYIDININDTSLRRTLVYDDREQLEEKYQELYESLRAEERIRSAVMKINGKWVHEWRETP